MHRSRDEGPRSLEDLCQKPPVTCKLMQELEKAIHEDVISGNHLGEAVHRSFVASSLLRQVTFKISSSSGANDTTRLNEILNPQLIKKHDECLEAMQQTMISWRKLCKETLEYSTAGFLCAKEGHNKVALKLFTLATQALNGMTETTVNQVTKTEEMMSVLSDVSRQICDLLYDSEAHQKSVKLHSLLKEAIGATRWCTSTLQTHQNFLSCARTDCERTKEFLGASVYSRLTNKRYSLKIILSPETFRNGAFEGHCRLQALKRQLKSSIQLIGEAIKRVNKRKVTEHPRGPAEAEAQLNEMIEADEREKEEFLAWIKEWEKQSAGQTTATETDRNDWAEW